MTSLQERLDAALKDAMRRRDKVAMSALRSVIGVISNAEAVPFHEADESVARPDLADTDQSRVAGAARGLGVGEMPRRELTEGEVASIVLGEIETRRAAAAEYRRLGQDLHGERLDLEADVLSAHLP